MTLGKPTLLPDAMQSHSSLDSDAQSMAAFGHDDNRRTNSLARVSLGLSQHQLARMTSLAPNTIKGVESGANPMVSTLRVLESALKAQGCLFGANDSVGVKMKWEGGRPRDPQVRASVLKILNSEKKSWASAFCGH